jgi:RND family efflux transporter MFP subunit
MSFWKQAVFCLVLIAAAAGGWYLYRNPDMTGKAEGAADSRGHKGIPGVIGGGAVNVVTAPVVADAAGDVVTALGTAKAAQTVTLYPQDSGMVAEVDVVPGRRVAQGDLLIRLQDDEQKVAVEKAAIALKQAEDNLERQRALAKSKTISSVALSDSETAERMAEVELQAAKIALDRRRIVAPFPGVTGLTDLALGDFVTTTTALARIDDDSTMRVDFEVPERWAGEVRQGQVISATAQAFPGSKFTGKIIGIDNQIDQTTRTLRLRAEIANDQGLIKTGMAIVVSLEFNTDRQLAVPGLAVQWDRHGSFVWKVAEGAVRRADVAILRRESGIVVVKGDLDVGEKVVVEGLMRLRDGAKVTEVDESPTIVDEAAPGAPAETLAPAVSGEAAPVATRG